MRLVTAISRRNALLLTGAVIAGVPAAVGPVRGTEGTKQWIVEIKHFVFEPEHLEIAPGDTVVWVNRDLVPHTASSDEAIWDTGALGKEEAGEVAFEEPGDHRYFCAFHPNMRGTLRVSA